MKVLARFLLPFLLLLGWQAAFAESNTGKVLVVLMAKEASIHATKKGGLYQLRLKGVNPNVTYFSSRPSRVSGQMRTETFVAEWTQGEFKRSAPNAVLEAVQFNSRTNQLNKTQSDYAVVLKKPVYNLSMNELTFNIRELPGNKMALPALAKSDYVALFIDDVCLTCIG